MTEIKEVKDLNTIAGIRRVTQESIRPVIEEIQRKMNALSQQNQELTAKTQYLLDLQKRLGRSEETVRYLQSQMLKVREQCQNMQLQQTKQKDQAAVFEERLKEEMRSMKKDKQKQDAIIQNTTDKTQQMSGELTMTLGLVKKREQVMQNRFTTLNQNAENLSFEIKQTSSHLQKQFNSISSVLNNELKTNEKRLKLLDSYEMEREVLAMRMSDLTEAIGNTVKRQDYAEYKQCLKKDQQRFVGSIKSMIEDNLSETTKNLLTELPQMKQSLKHCLCFEDMIESNQLKMKQVNRNMEINSNKHAENSLRFKKEVQQHFRNIQKQQKDMKANIQKALDFEGSMKLKLNRYSQQLKEEMREENYKKSRELYEQIKISFADKKEEIRERQLQKIVEERLKLFNRCLQMQNLGNKIGEILTNFSAKFTKIKSDNELFVETVNREMTEVHQLSKTIRGNSTKIGQVIGQLMETMLMNTCIQIESEAKINDDLAFSTRFDGVIYQRYPRSKGQNSGKILYRRKLMDMKMLKRAMVTSIIHIYDELMDQNCCLGWHEQSPSLFFKQYVEPIYKNIAQKYEQVQQVVRVKEADTIDLSTIAMIERQTINSAMMTSEPYKKASVRSRKRYDNSGQIFATKSVRKVRALSSNYGMN